MKLRISIIFIFLLYTIDSFAQGDFKKGFILSTTNDTIFGQIQFRSNSKNYQSCIFKCDNKIVEYSPTQIHGFGYENDKYFSSLIVNGSFVEVLVTGSISLYKFETYFLLSKDSTIHKLIDVEQTKEINGVFVKGSDNKWRGQLSFLVYDHIPNIVDFIAKIPFSEEELTKIVLRYNNSSKANYIEYKKFKPWTKFDYGAMIGLEKTTITIKNGSSLQYLPDNYTSIDPIIGFVLSLSSPRISEKLAFQQEIQFAKSKFSGFKTNTLSSYQSENINTNIELTTFSLPLSIKYSLVGDKHSVFVQGGANYEYYLKAKTILQRKLITISDTYSYPQSAAFDIDKSHLGIWGGLGILRSFDRYQLSANIRFYQMMNVSKAYELVAKPNHLAVSIIIIN